ncbi:hypothetical protein ACIRP3_20215 [Streptomyces sp. NPDC101209]|uniref:hypothetical protein n=1 Tax=Streptomyces sp. NPDC101209 TaxID=3366129 RepID=UPI003806AB1C
MSGAEGTSGDRGRRWSVAGASRHLLGVGGGRASRHLLGVGGGGTRGHRVAVAVAVAVRRG